jgi:hypothetical protein
MIFSEVTKTMSYMSGWSLPWLRLELGSKNLFNFHGYSVMSNLMLYNVSYKSLLVRMNLRAQTVCIFLDGEYVSIK